MTAELRFERAPEVAARLNIGVSTLWKRVADGSVPKPRKLGANTFWSSEDIDSVIRGEFKEAA